MPVPSTASATAGRNELKHGRKFAAVGAWVVLGVATVAGAQVKKAPAGTGTAAAAHAAGKTAAVAAAAASPYADRYREVCAACHGASGRSDMAGTPVLAGQHSLYAITQLFMFREGRRDNAAMVAIAKPMTDADLRGFSEFIDTLPPVPAAAPAEPPDAARMNKGQALAQQHKCVFCHGAMLDGGQGVPRIGGQKEDYLRMALHGFKSGERAGYTRAMSEALSQVSVEDLDLLAYYVANVGVK